MTTRLDLQRPPSRYHRNVSRQMQRGYSSLPHPQWGDPWGAGGGGGPSVDKMATDFAMVFYLDDPVETGSIPGQVGLLASDGRGDELPAFKPWRPDMTAVAFSLTTLTANTAGANPIGWWERSPAQYLTIAGVECWNISDSLGQFPSTQRGPGRWHLIPRSINPAAAYGDRWTRTGAPAYDLVELRAWLDANGGAGIADLFAYSTTTSAAGDPPDVSHKIMVCSLAQAAKWAGFTAPVIAPPPPPPVPTSSNTKAEILAWLATQGVNITLPAITRLTKAELLELVEHIVNGDVDPAGIV